MKIRLLLLLLLFSFGMLKAQDTIKTLIITEVRLDDERDFYVELTNMGANPIDLSQFELGQIGAWTLPWTPSSTSFYTMLPKKTLAPGASYLVALVADWTHEQWLKNPDPSINPDEWHSKPGFFKIADMQLNMAESPKSDPTDSVTPYWHIGEVWNGRDCIYVRHHFLKKDNSRDSVVTDQVNGIFDDAGGTRHVKDAADVAGVTNGTKTCVLIRRFSVKTGNLDFVTGKGTNADNSEWIAIPFLKSNWEFERAIFWTAGNHVRAHLSELSSSKMTIDWRDTSLTIPWGVRHDDSVMFQFDKKPGFAWHYDYAPSHIDSAYVSARTGDILTVYACGDSVKIAKFKIKVDAPTTAANIVISKNVPSSAYGRKGFYNTGYPNGAAYKFCEITDKNPVIDTISGIPYACRVDTMLKYLEKAPKATWEVVFVDGVTRVDLKKGDKLKVTAENGTSKEYFIKPNRYFPLHNSTLSAITWPDIPAFYKDLYGWTGDTVPNFTPKNYVYKVQIPVDVNGIPGLVAKTQDINAKYKVDKAKSLTGTDADKTVTFTSTAQDDTTISVYKIQLEKMKSVANTQEWKGEPFISQLIHWDQWDNGFVELVNPRPVELDLSYYMLIGSGVNNPADAIKEHINDVQADFDNRYYKYIPGKKWKANLAEWATNPALAIDDPTVNSIVEPGDVFVLGMIRSQYAGSGYPWFASKACDIDFFTGHNPWGETYDGQTCCRQWGIGPSAGNYYLFKILNDSVRNGLKKANNPNDFQLIDAWGSGDGTTWNIAGANVENPEGYTRKPECFRGKTGFKESFGTNATNSDWIPITVSMNDAAKIQWPDNVLDISLGLGSHFMNPFTGYKSTVESSIYLVSLGYSKNESIRGLITGTTVNNFLTNIVKADTGEHIKIKSIANGSILSGSSALSFGDTLIVVSYDSVNTTKYVLSSQVLSNDAVLTSTKYTITHSGSTGLVGGFDWGINLKTLVDNVTVPTNASLTMVDKSGNYVALKALNLDTLDVNVQVSDQIRFEVVAEDRTTKIVYDLKPNATDKDAFVTSNVYDISQDASLIAFVPNGSSVTGFFQNLIPATGAFFKLFDKNEQERVFGNVVRDDKLVVTAADGVTTKVYYLSMLGAKANYLAYVLSKVYSVNQVNLAISGSLTQHIAIRDFIRNLTKADGASIKLVDKLGADIDTTKGNLAVGDKIIVTSGDGLISVSYSIDIVNTSVQDAISGIQINLYPNPSTGRVVYVSGVKTGSEIRVYNLLGSLVLDKIAVQDREVLKLQNAPDGVYFVKIITDGVQNVFKLVIKK
jgi:hypothetical protein